MLVALLSLAPPTAEAQEPESVRLVLLQQTPSAAPESPLQIRVGAVNESSTEYGDLQLTAAVYSAIGSRSAYEETLTTGSFSPQAAETRSVRGSLPPGEGRSFPPIEIPLTGFSVNALHPVTVELRADGGVTPLALLRTSVVFVATTPEVPLNVSLSFVIDEPVRMRPDGVFLDDTLERSLAPGGRIAKIVSALEATPVPVTLAISPLLLNEVRRMAGGYRVSGNGGPRNVGAGEAGAAAAAGMLERLRDVARQTGTEVVALPYASPSIPALAEAGLGTDLREQIERGEEVVREILEVEPSPTIFRPPGSALSGTGLDVLGLILGGDGQTEALLLDPDVLEPPLGQTLSPPIVAALRTAGGEVPAIAPDPILEERTESVPDDPALSAIRTLGELSALYFEQPSVDRGAAIVISEDETPRPEFLRALLRGLRPQPGVSFLRPVSATRVLYSETGEQDPPLEERRLQQSSRSSPVTEELASAIERTEEALDRLESVAPRPDLLEPMRRGILVSESRHLLGREDLALAFLTAARAAVSSEFDKIQPPDERSVITLTSRSGVIPLTIRNEADYPVNVRVALRSPGLEFLGGSSRDVTLEPPGESFSFPVRAQTTGRFGVAIEVQTPDGDPIASSKIVVRSTAYNRVALVLTIGAAVFLAMWWGRRFLPRRRA
jgi:hypothetical protein